MDETRKMSLLECEELAKEMNEDDLWFKADFPAGTTDCQWLDPWMGWYRGNESLVVVTFNTLDDAVRLQKRVRHLLSTAGEFTYTARCGTSYGSRGAHLVVDTSTTFTPNE
jgi:hypothetical protein